MPFTSTHVCQSFSAVLFGTSRQKDRDEIDRPTGPPCNSPGPVRKPDLITGFDPKDDLPLSTFTPTQGYYGPLLIINTALNLTRGAELAWQQESRIICAYTNPFGKQKYSLSTDRRIRWQPFTQVTQSRYPGLLFSPNMGYHSSPAITALLTLFNLRLGAWLLEIRRADRGDEMSLISVLHLLDELYRAHGRQQFIYLPLRRRAF